MTRTRRRGRPPALTTDAIAQTVLDIGFSNLTVTEVRNRLGVGQTTLYRYAADRDELVRIGLRFLLNNTAWPPLTGNWRHVLSQYALTLWHVWEAHPGSATEAARDYTPLLEMDLNDELCALLLRQGFAPADAVLALDIVFDMVTDNRRGVEQLSGERSKLPHNHRDRRDAHHRSHAHFNGTATATDDERDTARRAFAQAFAAEPVDWFTKKLGVVIDGIAHALAPKPAATSREKELPR
jgi:AcrR family transcriptional regulator